MSDSNKAMKREGVFNKNGFYKNVVRWNAIMHQEAIDLGKRILAEWIQKRKPRSSVRVLDLACGGMPITIAGMMEHCAKYAFNYTGVDINKEQIDKAQSEFKFPNNVRSSEFYEGDAWHLDELPIAGNYDLVFVGLNFHHATPEELYCIGKQINGRMACDGLLVNHDIYRPDDIAYLRRPCCPADDVSEPMDLMSDEWMKHLGIRSYRSCVKEASAGTPDWRVGFINGLHSYLRDMGGSEEDVSKNMEHIWRRDYPVSTMEISKIFSQVTLEPVVYRYDNTTHPLKNYFAMVTCSKPLGILR